jgi:hypothetical protein
LDFGTIALVSCLFAVTIVSAVEYYRQLRRGKREYEKARDAVEDIVLSFNRQFKRESEKLETIAYKVEAVGSKVDKASSTLENVERRMSGTEAKITFDSQDREGLTTRLVEVENHIRDIVASQQADEAKITALEQHLKQFPTLPEVNPEAVIPIRRDKALAHLTVTELSALEMLASEGSKTAPEIKERVKLSREHTARLMKKLYEEGYLDRETNKVPFKYSVKKEMEKFLRKTENQPA